MCLQRQPGRGDQCLDQGILNRPVHPQMQFGIRQGDRFGRWPRDEGQAHGHFL